MDSFFTLQATLQTASGCLQQEVILTYPVLPYLDLSIHMDAFSDI
jgi:hypothetical protein